MKLKEYKPKYKTLELMINNVGKYLTYAQLYDMCNEGKVVDYDKAVNKYGDYEIASIKNFEDTKTTSIILKNWKFN